MIAGRKLPAGVSAAVASALFLGLTPVFGKLAITAGVPALAVVALRTVGAAFLLLLVMGLFRRKFFYIYPLGLLGCLLAGTVNGIGSLLFYSSLARIDASLGQLLYSFYPLYVALLLYLDGYRYSRLTLLRLGLSVPAIVLLTSPTTNGDTLGMLMMIGAGLLYAIHIPINQRVLYEAPAPTVTFYTLLAMAAVVVPVAAIAAPGPSSWALAGLPAVGALTMITFLSRLTLFSGVKSIGGLQTALIGLGEVAVTLVLAHIWLGERLSSGQWAGALLLAATILLVGADRSTRPRVPLGGWLHWLLPPGIYGRGGQDPHPSETVESTSQPAE